VLLVHRASRGDWLAAELAELLEKPAGDPFSPEVVAVPTRGVERWLTQRLATRLGARPGREDGVCTNVEFPFPGTLVGQAVGAATGVNPKTDPWLPERSVWPLLSVVDSCIGEAWMSTLAAHLGAGEESGSDDPRRSRRFSAVRHLADLFDRYGVHRPGLIRQWAAGGTGEGLPADLAWQRQLWVGLRARIGVPSPAERLEQACSELSVSAALLDLPERVSLFGLTRLPSSYLDVLRALARHRDVHLWLLHPSAALWEAVARTASRSVPRRAEDATVQLPSSPLLGSWGRDAREMQLVLAAAGAGDGVVTPDGAHPPTLLGRIQSDVRADRTPGGLPASLEPGDCSLQVHACHGRARQVEVLRDAILHLLADDESLQPRDVIVMCPDIDAFAPLIQATFAAGPEVGVGGDLHVRLADRSIRQTNPVLAAVSRLLDMAGGRITASEVIDLAGCEPVRRRFLLDDDALVRLGEWVRGAGVRWGIDSAWRERYKLERVTEGTWAAGVERMLLGAAMSEDDLRTVDGVLPLDDVDSGEVTLVGRVAELVDRLGAAVRSFDDAQPVGSWVSAISSAVDTLMACDPAEEWQRSQLLSILKDVLDEADTPATDSLLSLAEVRALLGDRLRGKPTRANFRTGHLTMCTLVPMRSVPHRVVCLLGMDDGVFPRRSAPDGDDLIGRDPLAGDRDSRSEDRQLLLDALLAAQDCLVITYCGRDERTNAARPPAVPIGELLDVIDQTVSGWSVVAHPLQTFDARNFTDGGVGRAGRWSFDPVSLAGAQAAREPRSSDGILSGLPLPPLRRDPLELEDLSRFLEHPVRGFVRQRLGAALGWEEREPDDSLPLTLDGLEKWEIGDRLLGHCLAGVGVDAGIQAELARGTLPPGALAHPFSNEVAERVNALAAAAIVDHEARSVDVTAELPGGRSVVGTVSGIVGEVLQTVTYSRLGPKHRLAAWVRLLALCLSRPDADWTVRCVGRGGGARAVAVVVAAPPGTTPGERRQWASQRLAEVVDLYDRGMREPLPLFCQTSEAWAVAPTRGKDPLTEALYCWDGNPDHGIPGERADAAHQLVFGGSVELSALLDLPPAEDECEAGWPLAEPSRLGRLAGRLWTPILEVERWP
jgi:exodeoxyribonuclease V gamma subunit